MLECLVICWELLIKFCVKIFSQCILVRALNKFCLFFFFLPGRVEPDLGSPISENSMNLLQLPIECDRGGPEGNKNYHPLHISWSTDSSIVKCSIFRSSSQWVTYVFVTVVFTSLWTVRPFWTKLLFTSICQMDKSGNFSVEAEGTQPTSPIKHSVKPEFWGKQMTSGCLIKHSGKEYDVEWEKMFWNVDPVG